MKKILSYRTLFIAIIILASILRLYELGAVPPSPDWDEVALGYNGYSLAKTGKDEYGVFLPVVLRSFDDYKPALYAYLTIPTTSIFGLSVFAVRLPSAIFGIGTVFFVYLLVKELFKKESLALLSAFLLAISPWHIQFSRVAFETNVGLFFNVLTAYLFIRGLKKPWLLSLSAISAGLAIYTYQSEKVFTPLFVCILTIIFLKELFSLQKKYLIAAIISGIITVFPMVHYITTNEQALLRAQATLAFSDTTNFLKNQVTRIEYDRSHNNYLGLLFDNRRVLYFLTGVGGYLSHYDINWLFLRGDLNRHHAPGMGLLYLWELPFLLIGIYVLLMSRLAYDQKKGKYLFFAWFLLAPVPAAFTTGVPHAVRTLNFLPTFQLFTAWGILAAVPFFFKHKATLAKILWQGGGVFFGLFAALNFFYYLNQYFVQQNYFASKDWQYGYADAIAEVAKIEKNYKKIIISEEEPLDQAYMFFLFYLQYPPEKYHLESKATSGGFEDNHGFGKYEFRPIVRGKEERSSDVLYVGRPQDFEKEAKVLKEIRYLNGEPAILIVEG